LSRAVLVALVLWTSVAQARVFDIMNELNFAPYVRGTFGDSLVQKEAFVHGDGDTPVAASSQYNLSGEIGMLVHLSGPVNFRAGAEIIAPSSVTSAKGYNSSNQQLFSLDSQIFVFNPQAAFEIVLTKWKASRALFMFGAGYATVSLKNSYTLTAAGQTQFGINNNFTESATASDINYWAGFGYEFHFADRAMLMLEASYREFKVNNLDNSQAQTTIVNTSGAADGSRLLNMDGTGRKFDLSGAFVGLSFRFYLQ
jgi:hypothetical protein